MATFPGMDWLWIGNMTPEEANWSYIDSPWDLLRDCRSGSYSAVYCSLSSTLGILSGYVFPLISTFGLITNTWSGYVFMFRMRKKTRQILYLTGLALADNANLIAFGWFWIFPAKGLPYASNGNVYFFTFNVSPSVCRLHRYVYSFTSCLACNLFVLTVLDRCLAIWFPLTFSRKSNRTAWQAMGVTLLLSALMMIPYGVWTGHFAMHDEKKRIICWVADGSTFLQLYHVMFANCGFVQVIFVIFLNGALLFKVRKSLMRRQNLTQGGGQGVLKSSEIASCVLLLVLSSIYVVTSLPQSVAYMLAFAFQQTSNPDQGKIRMAYNISDIGWHLFFYQESTNWCIYIWRMANFRQASFASGCGPVSTGMDTEISTMQFDTTNKTVRFRQYQTRQETTVTVSDSALA